MNRRWIVLVAALCAFEWLLATLGFLGEGYALGAAAASSAVLVALGNCFGLIVIGGVKWAMRGDR